MTWKARFYFRVLGFPGVLHPTPTLLSPWDPCLHACRHPCPHVQALTGCPSVRQPLVWCAHQWAGHSQEDGPGQAMSGPVCPGRWSSSRGVGSEWAHFRGLLNPWEGMRLEDQRGPLESTVTEAGPPAELTGRTAWQPQGEKGRLTPWAACDRTPGFL